MGKKEDIVALIGLTLAWEPVAKHTAIRETILADDSAWTAGIMTNLDQLKVQLH